jgi:sigma-B regulation protein RsbU (phosphoserine phosphatase)
LPTAGYRSEEWTLAPPARLFLFSDGVYEISGPDGTVMNWASFEHVLARPVPDGKSDLEELLQFARARRGAEALEDDFSVVRLTI